TAPAVQMTANPKPCRNRLGPKASKYGERMSKKAYGPVGPVTRVPAGKDGCPSVTASSGVRTDSWSKTGACAPPSGKGSSQPGGPRPTFRPSGRFGDSQRSEPSECASSLDSWLCSLEAIPKGGPAPF